MKKKFLSSLGVAALLMTVGCSGVRESSGTFAAHGEAFRIFGYAIPGDDQQAALDRVPAGATITNVSASPADWTSFTGILRNIISFGCTQIGGTK